MTWITWALGALVVLLGLGAIALMRRGWRGRAARQSDLAGLPAVPELVQGQRFAGKYVATTAAGEPYERIAAAGLGFRGRATVTVASEGLLLDRVGEPALWIPRSELVDAGRATWTIDRVVEARGLHLLRWRLGGRELDTYLRMDEPSAFDAALGTREAA